MPAGMGVIPRNRSVERILATFNSRIRRLEVNHFGTPIAGIALYTIGSGSAGTSWTPDFSSATQVIDTIGCEAADSGLYIPQSWLWVAEVVFEVNTSSPPPTGDFLYWSATSDGDFSTETDIGLGEYRSDILFDSSAEDAAPQTFGATVGGATGFNDYAGVFVSEVESQLGTEFTPQAAGIGLWGIQLFTEGFPHASEEE